MINFKKFSIIFFLLFTSSISFAESDPFEKYNRQVWTFNEFLDDSFAKPAAEIYTSVTPDFVEIGMLSLIHI